MTDTERIDALEKRVVILEADDAKVKGIVTWINEKIMGNPKVTMILSALGAALLAWATTYFSVPATVAVPVPGPEVTVTKEVPVLIKEAPVDKGRVKTVLPETKSQPKE